METQITKTKKVKMSKDVTGKFFIRIVQDEQVLESKWASTEKGAVRIFNKMAAIEDSSRKISEANSQIIHLKRKGNKILHTTTPLKKG